MLEVALRERICCSNRVKEPVLKVDVELDNESALVSAVVASLTVKRISASAWRATVAALHLIRTSISTSTARRHTSSAIGHLTVSLGRHSRTSLTSVALIATASWTWASHWGLLIGIA